VTSDQWLVISSRGSTLGHCSLLTAHCSLLTAHCSLLTAHCSLPYSLNGPLADPTVVLTVARAGSILVKQDP